MVKVQKRFAYTYKNKDHYKHIINIPEDAIEKLGWKEGEEVNLHVENDKITFTKHKRGDTKWQKK